MLIGRLLTKPEPIALVRDYKSSPTTRRHISAAIQAAYAAKTHTVFAVPWFDDHIRNLDHLHREASNLALSAVRATRYANAYRSWLRNAVNVRNHYASLFKVRVPILYARSLLKEAKDDVLRRRRNRAITQRRLRRGRQIEAWLHGEIANCPPTSVLNFRKLRTDAGLKIETSDGRWLSLDEARHLLTISQLGWGAFQYRLRHLPRRSVIRKLCRPGTINTDQLAELLRQLAAGPNLTTPGDPKKPVEHTARTVLPDRYLEINHRG